MGELQEGLPVPLEVTVVCLWQGQVGDGLQRLQEHRQYGANRNLETGYWRTEETQGGDRESEANNPNTEDSCRDHTCTRSAASAEPGALIPSQHKWMIGNSFALDGGQT